MKWKIFPLASTDEKAKQQIINNLEMGAYEHTLSKKLLARFSNAIGPMELIAFETLDIDAPCLYGDATYRGGNRLAFPPTTEVLWTDSPRWGLIAFLETYLSKSANSFVFCENWIETRATYNAHHAPEADVLLFEDQVYRFLTTGAVGNQDLIECTIRESEERWTTGACSICSHVPLREISDESFFDQIVANTIHIFTPAIDNEGYLIWTPDRTGR